MLSAINRLTGHKNIEKAKSEGKLFQRKLFGLVVLDRKDKKPSRFAFVVSKKVHNNATHRNRVRRALREAVRYSITRTKKGYNVVFLSKKEIVKKMTDEIMREVTVSLKSVGLVK